MALDQELFDLKAEATKYYADTQAALSDELLAHALAVQLLDHSVEVGEDFKFDEAEVNGAIKVLCALMRGDFLADEVQTVQDATSAAFKEATIGVVLRRMHCATVEVIGVTMPGMALEVGNG